MSGDSQNMERSTLERKDRAELAAVAGALGLKVPSRAKKADIVTLILDVVAEPGSGPAPADPSSTDVEAGTGPAPTESPADIAAAETSSGALADAAGDQASEGREEQAASDSGSEAAAASSDGAPGDRQSERQGRDHQGGDHQGGDHQGGDHQGGDHQGGDQGDGDGDGNAEGGGRNRRRRRRGRDRVDGEGAAAGQDQFDGDPVEVAGLLDLRDDGYGFLRVAGFLPSRDDVYVSVKQCRQLGLRKGDHLTGLARPAGHKEKNPALTRVETVNGMDPEQARSRPRFDDLTPLLPDTLLPLDGGTGDGDSTGRIIDLIAPIGRGSRGLVVAAPESGRTAAVKTIANAIEHNHPDVQLIVLLVDERPEVVTDMRRSIKSGEVVASTFDRPADEHAAVAELTIEHAKRLVEYGHDVTIVADGLTRLTRAYNTLAPATGRTLAGGLDASALHPVKRLFGAARNIEEGGSLTILATVAEATGSVLDDVVFEEFIDTANLVLRLDGESGRAPARTLEVGASPERQATILADLLASEGS